MTLENHLELRNLEKEKFYYKVSEFVTVFGGRNFSNDETFNSGDLHNDRKKAIEWYDTRLKGIEERGSFDGIDFIPPTEKIVLGQDAAFSISIYFVIEGGVFEGEYPIFGEEDGECKDGLLTEKENFQYLNLEPPTDKPE